MGEEIIKAKIVFDDASFKKATAGLRGAVGGKGGEDGGVGGGFADAFAKTAFAQDFPIWGDILAGIGGLVLAVRAVFDLMKWAFNKLVDASPHLQATMEILNKTIKLTLRPIGDTISMLLRPFILAWLKFVLPIYKSWREWFGKDGQGGQSISIIAGGWEQIKEGIFEFDFEQMWAGVGQVWDGFKKLFSSFFSDVMKPQFDKIKEWWNNAKEQFGTTGFFDTLWASFKELGLEGIEFIMERLGMIGDEVDISSVGQALGIVFKSAWDTFKASVGDTAWGNLIIKFSEGLWTLWTDFTKKLEKFWWLGPLAPFAVAMMILWEKIVGPMVQSLKNKLIELLPGVMSAIDFGKDVGDGLKSGWETFKGWFKSDPIELPDFSGQTMTTDQLIDAGVIKDFQLINTEALNLKTNLEGMTFNSEFTTGIQTMGDTMTTAFSGDQVSMFNEQLAGTSLYTQQVASDLMALQETGGTTFTAWQDQINITGETFTLMTDGMSSSAMSADNAVKTASADMVSSFNLTSKSMQNSIGTTNQLISRLNAIPRKIVTVHVIKTVKE